MNDYLRQDSAKVVEIGGVETFVLIEKWEEQEWKFFVAFVDDKLLLVGTDVSYLLEVIERRMKRRPSSDLAKKLPELKWVNMQARYWGVRHFDRTLAATDPSSPVVARKSSVTISDTGAIGFGFYYDGVVGDPLVLRYLSVDADVGVRLADRFGCKGQDGQGSVRKIAPNVLELSCSLNDRSLIDRVQAILFAFLGHGVFT